MDGGLDWPHGVAVPIKCSARTRMRPCSAPVKSAAVMPTSWLNLRELKGSR